IQNETASLPRPPIIKVRKTEASRNQELCPLTTPATTASAFESTAVIEAFQSIADDIEGDLVHVVGTDGKLVGVFTSMDIVCHVIALGLDFRTTLAREVMTRHPFVCRETADPRRNFDLMVSQDTTHMPICNQNGEVVGICHLAEVFHEHLDIIQRKFKASEDIYNALLAAKASLDTDALYTQMLASAEELVDKHDTTNLTAAISDHPPSLVISSRYSVRRVSQLMKEKALSVACIVEEHTTNCTTPTIIGLCTSKDLAYYVSKFGLGALQHNVRRAVRNTAVTVLSSISVVDAARKMFGTFYVIQYTSTAFLKKKLAEENVMNIAVVDERGQVLAIVGMLFLAKVIQQEDNTETTSAIIHPADTTLSDPETYFPPLEATTPQLPPILPRRAKSSGGQLPLEISQSVDLEEIQSDDVNPSQANVTLRFPGDSSSTLQSVIPQDPPPSAVLETHKPVLRDRRYSNTTSIPSQEDTVTYPSSPSDIEHVSSRSITPAWYWYREKTTDDRVAKHFFEKGYSEKTSTSPPGPSLPPSPEIVSPRRPLPSVPSKERNLTGLKLLEFMSRQSSSKDDLSVARPSLQHHVNVDSQYDSPPEYYSPQSETPETAVWNKAWQPKLLKLIVLDDIALYEISTDVHDELLRRQRAWNSDTSRKFKSFLCEVI
ncbi:hypothetical protein H0H87_010452, partial [Tephrocybe sp. NHM501043]